VEIEGDLAPFTSLLRAAEIIHVGRGTPFGLGRVAVET
jgi:CRISPR/Cas system endoribonuclease Cas6 (RAMP superfamily)